MRSTMDTIECFYLGTIDLIVSRGNLVLLQVVIYPSLLFTNICFKIIKFSRVTISRNPLSVNPPIKASFHGDQQCSSLPWSKIIGVNCLIRL